MSESWVLLPDSLIAEMREDYERGQGSVAAAGSVPVRWWMWARELVRLNPEGIEPEYEWDVEHDHPYRPGEWTRQGLNGGREAVVELAAAAPSFRAVKRVLGPWVVVDDEGETS